MKLNFLYILLCRPQSFLQYLKALFSSCESVVSVQNKLCQIHLLLLESVLEELSVNTAAHRDMHCICFISNMWIDLLQFWVTPSLWSREESKGKAWLITRGETSFLVLSLSFSFSFSLGNELCVKSLHCLTRVKTSVISLCL